MWNFLYRLAIFMSLYVLYLGNPATDAIFLLYMERTFFFFENWDINCDIKTFMFTTLYCPNVSRYFTLQLCDTGLLVPRPPTIGSGSVCPSVRLSVRQQFLFRARSPILLGGIEWNLAQWKNIYCSCTPGYRFYRAAKNVPVGLDRKSRFF